MMGDSKLFKAMFGDATKQYRNIGGLFDDDPKEEPPVELDNRPKPATKQRDGAGFETVDVKKYIDKKQF